MSLPLDVEWQERDARRCPGSVLTAGFADSPLGCCLLAESLQGLCHLAFADGAGEGQGLWAGLQTRWPGVAVRRDDAWAKHLARRIFQPFPPAQIAGQPAPESGDMRLDGEPLRVLLRGTAFQWRVWQALIKIPPGCLVSYGQLAESIGKPGAARAVGSAVGKNPVAYLIPCHRVVQGTGEVGGYRWGCARKRAMLLWESGFCP